MAIFMFAFFASLSITIGVLTVYFTVPKPSKYTLFIDHLDRCTCLNICQCPIFSSPIGQPEIDEIDLLGAVYTSLS
jgi:hypothetical protein